MDSWLQDNSFQQWQSAQQPGFQGQLQVVISSKAQLLITSDIQSQQLQPSSLSSAQKMSAVAVSTAAMDL